MPKQPAQGHHCKAERMPMIQHVPIDFHGPDDGPTIIGLSLRIVMLRGTNRRMLGRTRITRKVPSRVSMMGMGFISVAARM